MLKPGPEADYSNYLPLIREFRKIIPHQGRTAVPNTGVLKYGREYIYKNYAGVYIFLEKQGK